MSKPEREIITVNVSVLDRFVDYFRSNNLGKYEEDHRRIESSDRMDDYLEAPASETSYSQNLPSAIIVNYDHPTCPITLPAGRRLRIGQTAGIVDAVEAFTPLEPMSWDEMQAEVARWIALLDGSGWVRGAGYYTPSKGIHENVTPADFARFTANAPKWVYVGFWEQCDTPYIKVSVQVRHYNSSSSGSFIPPAPLSDPIDAFAEDQFLMLIHFHVEPNSPIERELEQLSNMRRIEVNGDAQKPIPLATWLDDPDWRPEGWDGEYIK